MNRTQATVMNLFLNGIAVIATIFMFLGAMALAAVHYFLQVFLTLVVSASISFGMGSFIPLILGVIVILIGLGFAVKEEL